MKRDDTDFHRIDPRHYVIHDRLLNWARYVSSGGGRLSVMPMFRLYVSTEQYAQHEPTIPVDTLDGSAMEKAVAKLPEKHASAIRWHYVYATRGMQPGKVCRLLGVSAAGLAELVTDGRTMLKNRA